jgi:uncharacterized membrane protein
VLAFAVLYWLLDAGGPVVRSEGARRPPDFAFPQMMSPELAAPGWRPMFADYLYLAFTAATAFSPTDVMPMSRPAKMAMMLESSIALALFGLVVARAINTLAT